MSSSTTSVIDGPRRIRGVDLARGFAVVGMIAVHLIDTDLFEITEPSTWIAMANGNASVLFATLAGVSLAIANGGATPPTGDRLRRARRALVLRGAVVWAIGVVLIFTGVPVNIILTAYGLLFIVATLFLGLKPRTLIAVAAVLAVTMPVLVLLIDGTGDTPARSLGAQLIGWYYPFPVWAVYIALGLAAGRLLRSRSSPTIPAVWLTLTGAVLFLIGHLVLGPIATRADTGGPAWLTVLTVEAHSSGIGNVMGASGFALGAIGLCVLLCLTPVHWAVWPLRALGSMPLTAYVAHLLIWFLWILWAQPVDPLTEFRAVDPFWPTVLGLVLASSLWVLLLGKGPLERLVTRASTRLTPAT